MALLALAGQWVQLYLHARARSSLPSLSLVRGTYWVKRGVSFEMLNVSIEDVARWRPLSAVVKIQCYLAGCIYKHRLQFFKYKSHTCHILLMFNI